ncbi:MAG: hypothetical protein U1F71_00955 [Verrucomicrobiaceae bacterium]
MIQAGTMAGLNPSSSMLQPFSKAAKLSFTVPLYPDEGGENACTGVGGENAAIFGIAPAVEPLPFPIDNCCATGAGLASG